MKPVSRLFDAFSLFTLLVIVYSFFYSGTFVTDDEHILSSRALSFAFEGDFNNSRVMGNERIFGYSIIPETWANQALNIEPAQAVAAGTLALIASFLNIGRVQLMFLLNIWVTAAAALFVYLSATKMGYSRGVSLLVTAFFGLGTIVMPYSRTFFRDPLAMFFLTAAWYVAMVIRQSDLQTRADIPRTVVLWIIFIGLLAAGILSKNSVILAVPILFVEIMLHHQKNKNKVKRRQAVVFWLVPIIFLAILFLCWIFIVPEIPMLTRFSPNYYFTLILKFFTTPRPNLLQALVGPFISPGKSIFIFSPIMLLSLWSLIFRFRSSWSAWLYAILLVVVQALFYGSEWAGHVNWGLRFILPAIPILTLATAPAISALLKKRIGTAFLIGLLLVSFLIQVLATVVPIRQFYLDNLNAPVPITEFSTLWNFKESILPWSVNWILSAHPLDLAITRNPFVLWLLLPSTLVIITLTILGFKSIKLKGLIFISAILAIALNFVMVSQYRYDAPYSYTRTDFRQSQEFINAHFQTGDLVLVKSYSEDIWNYWMNWGDVSIPWTSLPFAYPSPNQIVDAQENNSPELALNKITIWIFNHQISTGRRVWLIVDHKSPTADYDFEGQWLKAHASISDCTFFAEGSATTSLCYFDITNQ